MNEIKNNSRWYETRFDFTKLRVYMNEHKISQRKLGKYSHLSQETIYKVLNNYDVTLLSVQSIIEALDEIEPNIKHSFNDICEYVNYK